jgi:hypothetical protein
VLDDVLALGGAHVLAEFGLFGEDVACRAEAAGLRAVEV